MLTWSGLELNGIGLDAVTETCDPMISLLFPARITAFQSTVVVPPCAADQAKVLATGSALGVKVMSLHALCAHAQVSVRIRWLWF